MDFKFRERNIKFNKLDSSAISVIVNNITKQTETKLKKYINDVQINECVKEIIQTIKTDSNDAIYKSTIELLIQQYEISMKPIIIQELKTELSLSVTEQLKNELRQSALNQLHSELRAPITEQLHSELKASVIEQLKTELRTPVTEQLKTELRTPVTEQLKTELRTHVTEQLKTELINQLRHELKPSILEQLNSSSITQTTINVNKLITEPSNDIIAEQLNSSVSQNKTNVPQNKTNVPQTKTNVPQTKTNVPQTKTNVPQTKTNVPQTKIDTTNDLKQLLLKQTKPQIVKVPKSDILSSQKNMSTNNKEDNQLMKGDFIKKMVAYKLTNIKY